MSKRRQLLLGLAMASVPTCVAAAEVQEAAGEYQFSDSRKELRELRIELDRVADQFGPIVRGFARRKLHKRVTPYSRVEVHAEDGSVSIQLGSQNAVPCDGVWHRVTNERGENGKMACRSKVERIRVRTEYDKGGRRDLIHV